MLFAFSIVILNAVHMYLFPAYTVFVGRHLLVLVGVEGAPDIYTAAIGFYIISLACRTGSSLFGHLVKGFKPFAQQLGVWTVHMWLGV